jgi:hypothetical protein
MSNRSSGEQSMTVVDACLPRGIGFHRVPDADRDSQGLSYCQRRTTRLSRPKSVT